LPEIIIHAINKQQPLFEKNLIYQSFHFTFKFIYFIKKMVVNYCLFQNLTIYANLSVIGISVMVL